MNNGDSDDENIENINGVNVYLNNFMKNVTQQIQDDIKDAFKKKLNENQLHRLLKSYNVNLSKENFEPLFAKIDVKKEGKVDFLQFMTYVTTECETKYTRFKQSERELIELMPKLIGKKLCKTKNRIKMITFMPFHKDYQISTKIPDSGNYLACTKLGEVEFYTSDIKWLNTAKMLPKTKLSSMVAMCDLHVLCMSTYCNRLLFYDADPTDFRLLWVVTQMPYISTCLAYHSDSSRRLAVGNSKGGVVVFKIVSENGDPFNRHYGDGKPVIHSVFDTYHYTKRPGGRRQRRQLKLKGLIDGDEDDRGPLRGTLFKALHPKEVSSVAFCGRGGRWLASTSRSAYRSLAFSRVEGNPKERHPVRHASVPGGLFCVCAADEDCQRVASGGADRYVRLWNVTHQQISNTTTTLDSHSGCVRHVFRNPCNGFLYSVSNDCVVNVWNVSNATHMLMFRFDTDGLQTQSRFAAHFNCYDQIFVMETSGYLFSIECGGRSRRFKGNVTPTHDAPVVKTLYSPVYRLLVSVSTVDSTIIVWNPRTGEAIVTLSMAHTEEVYCKLLPVEISAASLDPTGGLLVTGAINGTVHVWDLNNGTCLNRLRTPSRSRVSDILWLPDKLLAMGWDRRVTEFNDPLLVSNGKVWLWEHNDVVLSTCVKWPSLLVTTCRAGEISFWRLETGQLKQKSRARGWPGRSGLRSQMASSASLGTANLGSANIGSTNLGSANLGSVNLGSENLGSANFGSANLVASGHGGGMDAAETQGQAMTKPDAIQPRRRERIAAVASHFLRARPEAQHVGTLLVATVNGAVQLWCTDRVPRYVSQFQAAHLDGDYVTSMASDKHSKYLFTALDSGYLKTWFMVDWGRPCGGTAPTPLRSIRCHFPFLLESMFVGRAERAATALNPAGPQLVNSYRAHAQRINHVEYVDIMQMVVTSSVDMTIRLWTLAGHYQGVLGTQWPYISRSRAVNVTEFKIPSDIEREASFTTMKVLNDGANSALRTPQLWEKLEALRIERYIKGNNVKRKLQGEKSTTPLFKSLYTKHKEYKDYDIITYVKSKAHLEAFEHVPLFNLADVTLVDDMNDALTRHEKRITFK